MMEAEIGRGTGAGARCGTSSSGSRPHSVADCVVRFSTSSHSGRSVCAYERDRAGQPRRPERLPAAAGCAGAGNGDGLSAGSRLQIRPARTGIERCCTGIHHPEKRQGLVDSIAGDFVRQELPAGDELEQRQSVFGIGRP